MPKAAIFILLLVITAALLACGRWMGLPLDRRQIESLTIFFGLIWGILLFEDRRLAIALGGVAALLGFGLLSVEQLVASSELDIILFLLGTFLVAGFLEQSMFFEHLVSQIIRRVGPRPALLLSVLMVAAMVTSAVVGEVAAILFVGGAMLRITDRCKLNPAPFLMMLVFATNTGSAATAFGPIGVTISLKAHLSVMDFFRWTTPIAVAVLLLVMVLCRLIFARDWRELAAAVHREHSALSLVDPSQPRNIRAGWILVAAMAGLLIFHGQIEHYFALTANVLLLAAALGAGAGALVLSGRYSRELIEQRVDWATLAFF